MTSILILILAISLFVDNKCTKNKLYGQTEDGAVLTPTSVSEPLISLLIKLTLIIGSITPFPTMIGKIFE